MNHSSSILDRITRSSRKYYSRMRLLRTMVSSVYFQIRIKDPRSNLVMKWNYLQQHMSSTKSLIKIEDKDQTRISKKQLLDRFNQLPTRREKSQWAFQVFQTISIMLVNKRLHNKLVVFKLVITINQIRADHLQVWSILQLLALIRCLDHNPIRDLSSTKTLRVSRINHLKSQPYLSNSLHQANSNNKRRSWSLVMIFWSSMLIDWWIRLRSWMMRISYRSNGRGLLRSSSHIMSGTHRTEERSRAPWPALSKD